MIKQKNFLVLFVFTVMIFVSCQQEISSSYHSSSENRTYTVTFYPNNNSSSWSISVQEGDTVSQPDNPKRKGYSFEYWYKSNSFSKFDFSSPIKNDCSLYAKWIPLKYRITYILNDGFWIDPYYDYQIQYYSTEDNVYLPDSTSLLKQGYDFCGWYEASDFSGTPKNKINKGTIGNKTYFAKWEKIISPVQPSDEEVDTPQNPEPTYYNISYKLNNGSWTEYFDNNFKYSDCEQYRLPGEETVFRKGYKFCGWSESSSISDKRINYVLDCGTSGDKTFYANWEIISYTIDYELNGGDWIYSSDYTQYTVEDEIELPDETYLQLEGYYFDGWSDYYGEKITKIEKGSTENRVFYASWKQIPQYSIRYELNEGFWVENNYKEVYTNEESFYLPTENEIKRDGYIFMGWYENDDFTGEQITYIQKGSTGDKKFYAQWNPEPQYKITYNLNEGIWLETDIRDVFTARDSFELPNEEMLQRKGYKFMGWYCKSDFSGAQINYIYENTKENLILYANWEIISYTIDYELNGGEWNHEVQNNYTINDNFMLPDSDSLYRYGYTFDGWYYNNPRNNAEMRIEYIEKGTIGDKSVYAKWTKDIEVISVILESVSGDKKITFEVKNFYYLSANIAKSPYETNVASWFWKVDGIKAQNATNVSYPYTLYFGDMDAGYHNATLVITTNDGKTYSANAIFTIKK